MTYVQKESQTNDEMVHQKTKLKSGICDSQQQRHRYSKPVKYDNERIFILTWKWQGRRVSTL